MGGGGEEEKWYFSLSWSYRDTFWFIINIVCMYTYSSMMMIIDRYTYNSVQSPTHRFLLHAGGVTFFEWITWWLEQNVSPFCPRIHVSYTHSLCVCTLRIYLTKHRDWVCRHRYWFRGSFSHYQSFLPYSAIISSTPDDFFWPNIGCSLATIDLLSLWIIIQLHKCYPNSLWVSTNSCWPIKFWLE